MKFIEKFKSSSMLLKLVLLIVIVGMAVFMISIFANIDKNSGEREIIGNWEVKYGTIKGIDYLNYTFNEDKTFKWVIKNANQEEITYTGTYKMGPKKMLLIKLSNGNAITNTVKLADGNLWYEDVALFKVGEFSAKKSEDLKLPTANNNQTSQKKQPEQTYNCALEGCPNKTNETGAYCTVHAKGKINKCITCGANIWADEIYCDDCLFGDFDFSEYGIDY